jgi:hypothetical protein
LELREDGDSTPSRGEVSSPEKALFSGTFSSLPTSKREIEEIYGSHVGFGQAGTADDGGWVVGFEGSGI